MESIFTTSVTMSGKMRNWVRFTPRRILDSRSRHRTMVPQKEYENGHLLVSKTAKQLTDAGVKVNMGAHGQLQGLGAHWETWMLAAGGMTNLEALKAATINAANYIGAGNDIGSLEDRKNGRPYHSNQKPIGGH